MSIDNLVKTVMSKLKEIARTETVVGKAIRAGKTTIIPVSKVSVGFGAGGGGGKENEKSRGSGAGTGGGLSIEPIAFIVVNEEGSAQLLPLTKQEATISKVLDSIPSIIGKIKDFKSEKEKKEEDKTENSK